MFTDLGRKGWSTKRYFAAQRPFAFLNCLYHFLKGCDFIIALTHMRWPNNVRLAECVDEVDLILAGHDHFYRCEKINGKIVVVSGCEFRQLTRLTVNFTKSGYTM